MALMGGTPVKIRLGNAMKLPPPATELRVPPRKAAIKRSQRAATRKNPKASNPTYTSAAILRSDKARPRNISPIF